MHAVRVVVVLRLINSSVPQSLVLFCPHYTILVMFGLSTVDPHHSTEGNNSTKYTVGTVGISDIFAVCQAQLPARLDEGSGACLVLPQRATALCQPFPGAAGLCRATTQKFCML